MRITLLVGLAMLAAVAAADEHPRLRGAETPRATALLQAEKMAKRLESRLRTSSPHRSRWKHGGTGWESPREPTAPPSNVTVEIRGPRRRSPPL